MRTTLDIDDDVLQAAKELARTEGKTTGRVASDLMRRALTRPSSASRLTVVAGIPVLASRGSQPVTKEFIDRLIEETDLEEGRLSLER